MWHLLGLSGPLTSAANCTLLPPTVVHLQYCYRVRKFVPVITCHTPVSSSTPYARQDSVSPPAQALTTPGIAAVLSSEPLHAREDRKRTGWRVARAVLTPTLLHVMCCIHGILPFGWLLHDCSAGVGYCLASQFTAQEGIWRKRLFHCWDGDSGLLLFTLWCCLIRSGCFPKAERNMGPALESCV